MPCVRRPVVAWLAALLSLAGCMSEEEAAKSRAALSHPGPWVIPPETLAIGDTQTVEYTGAGTWRGTSSCTGGITPGAEVLRGFLQDAFPQVSGIGGYSCRHINGNSSQTSVHATGRALDIFIPLHEGAADNDLGDPLGNWLIENAEEIGVQFIIWDRWTWGAHRATGDKDRSYGGAHPHHDHLHVEVSVEASSMGTDWFEGPMELPGVDDCEDLPQDGIVDDASTCFRAYGPAEYWRTEPMGHGGGLRWTNAFESDSPSNWARWHVRPVEAGEYAVDVWIEPEWGQFEQARYLVVHAGITSEVVVDQAASSGWTHLGVFPFDAGGGQHVSVYDDSPTPVGEAARLVADAVRLSDPGSELVLPAGHVELPSGSVRVQGNVRLRGSCAAVPGDTDVPPALAIAWLTVAVALSRRRRRRRRRRSRRPR